MNPFGPVSESETKGFVRLVAELLKDKFRVEIKWNVTEFGMRPPNAELMVGVPGTEIRTYRTIKLPTWASPYQIAGIIESELVVKYNAMVQGGVIVSNPALTVQGELGVEEVDTFSARKVV